MWARGRRRTMALRLGGRAQTDRASVRGVFLGGLVVWPPLGALGAQRIDADEVVAAAAALRAQPAGVLQGRETERRVFRGGPDRATVAAGTAARRFSADGFDFFPHGAEDYWVL